MCASASRPNDGIVERISKCGSPGTWSRQRPAMPNTWYGKRADTCRISSRTCLEAMSPRAVSGPFPGMVVLAYLSSVCFSVIICVCSISSTSCSMRLPSVAKFARRYMQAVKSTSLSTVDVATYGYRSTHSRGGTGRRHRRSSCSKKHRLTCRVLCARLPGLRISGFKMADQPRRIVQAAAL